jgi:cytochrome c-type biogenesis protein CcmH/NrfG
MIGAGVLVVSVVVGVPALVFVLWPLFGRDQRRRTLLPLPVDRRQELAEDKRVALGAIRELEFEHAAGHVSDADFAELRARYEGEAAAILTELDRLGPVEPAPARAAPREPRRSARRHPAMLATGAVLLVAFGIAVGAGIVRYTEPDPMAGQPAPGSRPLAALPREAPGATELPSASNAPAITPGRPLPPEMLRGMLQAARSSLAAGRYNEAIAAYQAVLKRDPNNVDATTHLGLILAVGGGPEHAERALEIFDRALAIDPNYLPALLYRGQVLYEAKNDVAGAVRSWEKFVAVAPPGEDRDRVAKMIRDAQAKR